MHLSLSSSNGGRLLLLKCRVENQDRHRSLNSLLIFFTILAPAANSEYHFMVIALSMAYNLPVFHQLITLTAAGHQSASELGLGHY